MPWKKVDGWGHEPRPGSDLDYAKTFVLSDGEKTIETIVEFAAPSSTAGPKEAERVLKIFLSMETPPRRVRVSSNGEVSVP
jgi:hypothetical protein